MRSVSASPIQVVILGSDALLAGRPAEPIQLSRACLRAGFDFVAPVSWGEELLAARVADLVEARSPASMVVANCPFVAESLRDRLPRSPIAASVSPPVATARYLRAAFPAHTLHITYVGACPGASAPDIDERLLPDVLLAGLIESGIELAGQPCHFDGQLPPDRARHASMPGGVPHPRWLLERVGAIGLEATPATVDAVVAMRADATVVLDLGSACGCACARDRAMAARLDPPRSPTPVVLPLPVALAERRLLPTDQLVEFEDAEVESGPSGDRTQEVRNRESRATFLERGLSAVDALRPLEPLTSQRLSVSLEPWADVTDRAGLAADKPASIRTEKEVDHSVADARMPDAPASPAQVRTPVDR